MRKITSLIILFISIQFYAQRVQINGTISDNLGIVDNAHIINLTSVEGTFSDSKGYFLINAQVGDVLQITSIQHYSKKMKVSSITMDRKKINILLEIQDRVLDEIEIKKTNLLQKLTADAKKTPKDPGVEKSKNATQFKDVSATDNIVLASAIEKSDSEMKTDPILAFEGLTLMRFSLLTSNEEKRLNNQIKKEVFRDHLPERIMNIVGKKNFTETIKIPEDQILNFINYSIDDEIKTNVQREEHLKVIQNLKEKSVDYLKELGR
ncbi:hypothetical protein [Tenacibaculum jejuense]|uniref:Uncharacterized protein n=1 Tax=Tenacibaculum jejuense TaxID=584609 RepID=A0A238UAZ1_9FLAO|nr:hypothetical protein [Tenacibaculum jejuense]SNR16156.1 Protein of unknown function precursor [Tenacibaculum jejuense]